MSRELRRSPGSRHATRSGGNASGSGYGGSPELPQASILAAFGMRLVRTTLRKRWTDYSILGMPTLADALTQAAQQLEPSTTARRDAELLLLLITGITRAQLMTHPDRELTAAQAISYRDAITRRADHEPVQYITGAQEFYGRPFAVSPAVLIPRPETEHLIEAVLECMRVPHPNEVRVGELSLTPQPRILDIGTGSGILAITLALEIPNATVTATDLSPTALAVAQQNAAALGATEHIRFLVSDLFAALRPDEQFDCIVSNPPYVPAQEQLEPQVRDYEPAVALYAGDDGLAVYRRLIPQALSHLDPGGHLLLEIGHSQSAAVAALLEDAGFKSVRFVDDLQGIPRVAAARRPLA